VPSVLIVDDEADMRFLVRCVVEEADWLVAGEASSGEEAVDRWRELRPDVIVLDHRLPGLTGLEAAALILAEDNAQVIVLFSMVMDGALDRAAINLGVRRCLSKNDLPHLMAALIAQVEAEDGRAS
jgi:CheY-like chemotaxis protein